MATKKPKKQPTPSSMKFNDDDFVSPEVVQKYKDKFKEAFGPNVNKFSTESLNWFRARISKDVRLGSQQSKLLNQNVYGRKSGTENTQLIGKLYFYEYAAENPGDAELQVYDRFPMVFIFNSTRSKEGNILLHGLNIHYLSPKERQILLEKLLTVKSSAQIRPQTRLKLSWDIIKAVASSALYERAVHTYRVDRFQSRLIEIPANDWCLCPFLPFQKWIHIEDDGLSQSDYRKAITDRARRDKNKH